MIDLHAHLLPGIDDGAETMADAVDMVRAARDDGIGVIVATPHRNRWSAPSDRPDVERHLATLQDRVEREQLAVRVLLGSEAYVAPDLVEQVQSGRVWTINQGRYLLIEWPYDYYPPYSEQVIFELQLQGIVPIVAHAERYRIVRREPSYLATLIERGVVVQVTAGSLLGALGTEIQRVAEQLLISGLAQVLASDAHDLVHRPPILRAARDRAAELIGEARARAMVSDVPEQILANRLVDLPPPKPQRSRPFWAFWKSG